MRTSKAPDPVGIATPVRQCYAYTRAMTPRKNPLNLHVVKPETGGSDALLHPRNGARREYWFQQYLAMGPARSIRKLGVFAAEHPEIDGSRSPSTRTLTNWAKEDRWVKRVREHDQSVAVQAEQKSQEQQLASVQNRIDQRLKTAQSFRMLIVDALTYRKYETIDGVRTLVDTRIKHWQELDRDDIRSMIALHVAAERTELAIDGLPVQRLALEGNEDKPLEIRPPTDEELDRLRSTVGTLVTAIQKAGQTG